MASQLPAAVVPRRTGAGRWRLPSKLHNALVNRPFTSRVNTGGRDGHGTVPGTGAGDMMRRLFAGIAALTLAIGSADAAVVDFTYDTGAGIVLNGSVTEAAGVATSGSGTITSPFWTGAMPFILLAAGNDCCATAPPLVFSDRFGGGTDLIGDAAFNPANNPAVDSWGPIFAIGSQYTYGTGIGFNFWANNPGDPGNPGFQWFIAGNTPGTACCIYTGGNGGTLTAAVDTGTPVPEPIGLSLISVGMVGLGFARFRGRAIG